MKICPVGAELFRADGQTDRHDEANSRFSQFCEKRLKIAFEMMIIHFGMTFRSKLLSNKNFV